MTGLEWRAPAWILLALVPWLLRAWEQRRNRGDRLARYADPHLLSRLLLQTQGGRAQWIVPLAWTLAAVAAAGPTWTGGSESARAPGADIAVVVDISPSMAVADVPPDRLSRVKASLREFADAKNANRYALIVYSANAYVALPLTQDKDAFLHFVDALDVGLVGVPGSNLGRALTLAGEALQAARRGGGAVIVISDGGWHDRDIAFDARRLRERGIAVHALGVGTTFGAPVPDGAGGYVRDAGKLVTAPLNTDALRALARAGGGGYSALPRDASEWKAVRAALRQTQGEHSSAATLGFALWPWLLACAAALFLAAGTLRPASFAMWLAVAITLPLLQPAPAYAADAERLAYAALQRGDYAQAARHYAQIPGYAGAMGRAAVAYRRAQWGEAALLFREAERQAHTLRDKARATYNLGTTLARLHRYDEAKNAFRRALALQPNYPRASLNLSLLDSLAPQMRGTSEDGDEGIAASVRKPVQNSSTEQTGHRGGAQHTAQGTQPQTPAERSPQRAAQMTHRAAQTDGARGAADNASSGALHDDTRALLMRRFAIQDSQPGVLILGGKPW